MADTFVKNPKLIVGTQAQVESEMGANDIGFATDIRFYNATETDTLLASKQPVGDYATNSALASGLALKVAIAQGSENAGKILKIDNNGNVIVADESGGASLPILMPMWSDHVINDISWLRADTFSWQSGDVYVAAYEHLNSDLSNVDKLYCWYGDTRFYTKSETPSVGDTVYTNTGSDTGWTIEEIISSNSVVLSNGYSGSRDSANDELLPYTDVIDGTTITYYLAQDGHKICLPDQEANITHVRNRTGYANYYILDTENKQLKLPRKQKRKLVLSFKEDNAQNVWYKLYSDGWVEQGGFFAGNFGGSYAFDFPITMADTNYTLTTGAGCPNIGGMHGKDYIASRTEGGFVYTNGSLSNNFVNNNFSWQVSGYANPAVVPSSLLELEYYYVGHFEQDSIEQTAGINTETFNGKADRNLMNTTDNVDIVIESQLPTEANGYTWYRKYKSGWVEQGGFIARNAAEQNTVTFSVPMANTNYSVSVTGDWTGKLAYAPVANKESATATGISLIKDGAGMGLWWQVSGMAE